MLLYSLRRVAAIIPLLLIVTIISFGLIELAPGDAAVSIAGDQASSEDIGRIREALGLNDGVVNRYLDFLGGALNGDLGSSLYSSQSVTSMISYRLPVTISLVVLSLTIACLIGIPIGVAAALRRGSFVDRLLSAVSALAVAIPAFVLAVFMLKIFAIDRAFLPATGYVPITEDPMMWLKSLVLPAAALSVLPGAEMARIVRASFSDVAQRDFIDTARAKGLGSRSIVVKHTLKNAAVPVVTILGVQIGRLIGGSVIIERIFNLPGLGNLMINSVLFRDVPVIQGTVLFAATLVVVVNLVVDLSYGYFNPRVRH